VTSSLISSSLNHVAKISELPPDLRPLAVTDGDKVRLTPELETALLDTTIEAIGPLKEAGKLGALLLQLSPSFSPRYHQIKELERIIDRLGAYRLAVELRNRNWMISEKAHEVTRYFEERGVSLVMVDAPISTNFTVMPEFEVVTTPKLAYLRLHGRDEKAYTTGRTVSERFNYAYSEEDVKETIEKADRLAEAADDVHIIYNNNHSNLAPKAAEAFQAMRASHATPKY